MPRDPKKINPYVLFDWEIGGLECKKNPVMEFAGVGVNGVTLEEIVKYDNLVKPYDAGLIYEPVALKINGLTVSQCEKDGVDLKTLVSDICLLFDEVNAISGKNSKLILVAHNAPFDVPFLQDVFLRCRVDLSKYCMGYTDRNGLFHPKFIDTIDLCKAVWAEITDTDTNFKLATCCERAAIDFYDGHRALRDTLALTDLFRFLLTRLRSGSSELVMQNGQITSHRKTFQWL